MQKLTVADLVKALETLDGLTTNVVSIGEPYYDPSGTPVEVVDGKPVGNNAVDLTLVPPLNPW